MTKEYFFSSPKIGILQLLDKKQGHLVPILGKRSGYEEGYNKELECESIGFKWTAFGDTKMGNDEEDEEEEIVEDIFQSIKVLPNCQSYIKCRILETIDAGDHEVALCQVLGVGRWDDNFKRVVQVDANDIQQAKDEQDVLYTGFLRNEEII